MYKIHRVVLSSGHVLLVEERLASLSIAIEDERIEGQIGYYICSIEPGGVLVMPNSGDATEWLSRGLVPL